MAPCIVDELLMNGQGRVSSLVICVGNYPDSYLKK